MKFDGSKYGTDIGKMLKLSNGIIDFYLWNAIEEMDQGIYDWHISHPTKIGKIYCCWFHECICIATI